MTAWVDCSATPSYFGGFAADMGPYIGPWPLLPPGVVDGSDPSFGGEFDFYVALPNPVDTTDVTIAADGTYDTPIWDANRFTTTAPPTSDTDFGYSGDSTGPSAPFPVPSAAPAGVHLYVVYFSFGTFAPPTNPPEHYVPASYAAGGAAAFETAMGHWSATQGAFSQTKPVTSTAGVSAHYHATDTFAGDHDVLAAVTAQIAAILAATPVGGTDTLSVQATKTDSVVLGSPVFETVVDTNANLDILPFDGAPSLAADFPPPLLALTHDVDYTETPYIGPTGLPGKSYRYDSSAAWAWAASGAVDGYSWETSSDGGTGEPVPFGIATRVQWVAGSVGGTPWTVSGNLIGDIAPIASSVPGSPNYAVDYSGVTALAFTLHTAPVFLYSGAIPGLGDFAMPVGSQTFQDQMLFIPSTPALLIDRSTWEFWVPGGIVPSGVLSGAWGIPA